MKTIFYKIVVYALTEIAIYPTNCDFRIVCDLQWACDREIQRKWMNRIYDILSATGCRGFGPTSQLDHQSYRTRFCYKQAFGKVNVLSYASVIVEQFYRWIASG